MEWAHTKAVKKLSLLKSRTKIVRGGTSAGKTFAILSLLIDYAIAIPYAEISVVTDTIPALRRGALKDFLNILKTTGIYKPHNYNKSSLKYEFSNGSYIEFFSTDSPDKLRGARRHCLFVNECNNVTFEAYQQLAIRTSRDIWLDYNPATLFWVDKELINQPNTDFITLTYKDNDVLPQTIIDELEKNREKAKTSTYWANWWKVYGLGQIGSLEGACIPAWKEIDIVPNEARLMGYGMDFGYSVDATSLVAMYKYNESYIFDEVLYRNKMLNSDISNFILNNNLMGYIYADSAEPKSIAELRSYGHDIFPVTKGKDSIIYGINLINQNEVFVTRRSKNLKKELEGYIWMKDKQGNTLQKPNPMNGDHAIDAARYCIMMVLENPNRGEYYLY